MTVRCRCCSIWSLLALLVPPTGVPAPSAWPALSAGQASSAVQHSDRARLEAQARELYAQDRLIEAGRIYLDLAATAPDASERNRTLLLAAWLQHQAGSAETDATLERLLTLSPNLIVAVDLYSQSFLDRIDQLRAEVLASSERHRREELSAALGHLRAGRAEEAARHLEPLLERQPNEPTALWLWARVCLLRGEWAVAAASYRTLLDLGALPSGVTRADLLAALGLVSLQGGELEAAASALRQAVSLDAETASSWYNLGLVSLGLGQPSEAEAALRHAVALEPGDAAALDALTGLLEGRGRASEVRALLEPFLAVAERAPDRSVTQGSEATPLWTRLARVQRASGAPREAVSSLARALASAEAEAQDELHVALALVHLDLDDVAAACAAAERAVALAPGSADALQVLGLCRLAEQDTAAALQALEQAREAAPGRADIANNLGRARYVAGDYRGAQAEFQNALELDPDLEVAKSNLELAGAARASSPLAAAAGGRSAGGTVATMARDGRPGLELRDGRNPSTGWSATEVIAVVAGANAERAGLRLGDWILRAGGERVTRGETLLARLAALRPGQHLRLDVLRDAQPLAIDYLLADIQGPQSPAPPVP